MKPKTTRDSTNILKLAHYIHDATGLCDDDSRAVARAVHQYFHDEILQGHRVSLGSIGRFMLVKRTGRVCRKGNIKWLNKVQPDSWRLRFQASNNFKDKINRKGKYAPEKQVTSNESNTPVESQVITQERPSHDQTQ